MDLQRPVYLKCKLNYSTTYKNPFLFFTTKLYVDMSIFEKRVAFKPWEYPEAMQFVDAINHSYWIHCVGPNERVNTSDGLLTVQELYDNGSELTLFNNEHLVRTTKMLKTGHRELFILKTKEGYEHTVTKDHRVKTPQGWVEVQNLRHNDLVCIQTTEGQFGTYHNPEYALLYGFYEGDGTRKEDTVVWQIWDHQYEHIPVFEDALSKLYTQKGFNRKVPSFGKEQFYNGSSVGTRQMTSKLLIDDFSKKGNVPDFIWKSNRETVSAYLMGLFFADGGAYQTHKRECVIFSQSNERFVKDIQLLLLNFGIKSSIRVKPAGVSILPNGKGGVSGYDRKPHYILEITASKSVAILNDITNIFEYRGKEYRGVVNENKSHPIVNARFESLVSVGHDDVYCVSVYSENKAWLCNGFITHNTEWNFVSDIQDFHVKLTAEEREVIRRALLAISQIEVSVKSFWGKVDEKFPKPEIGAVGTSFSESEIRHFRAYSHLLEVLGLNDDFSEVLSVPAIQGRVDYLTKYLQGASDNKDEKYVLTLTLFSLFIENVSLFRSVSHCESI